MNTQGRRAYYVGQAPLHVVTHYREKDSYLGGVLHGRKGWHWHFSSTLPYLWQGHPVENGHTVTGPFPTEEAALADAQRYLNGNYALPVRAVEADAKSFEIFPFVIHNGQEDDDRLWWSNDHGWVAPISSASRFHDIDVKNRDLPMGGQWEKLGA